MRLSKRAFSKNISPEQNRFFMGAFTGNIKLLIESLKAGADLHFGGEKALELAAEEGNLDIVRFLLDNKADPTARNYIAYKAAKKNKHDDVAALILKSIPLKKGKRDSQVKLLMGAFFGKVDEVIDAIEEGANIHENEERALEIAASKGNLEIVKILLERGADPRARNFAAYKAAIEGKHELVADFISKNTPIGTEEYAPSFKIPEIVQRKQLRPEGQGHRQPIKKDPFPEELTFAPEKEEEPQIFVALRKFLIQKFGKDFLYGVINDTHSLPEGFFQDKKDPNVIKSTFGWTLIPTAGGYKVFEENEFLGTISSLDDIVS